MSNDTYICTLSFVIIYLSSRGPSSYKYQTIEINVKKRIFQSNDETKTLHIYYIYIYIGKYSCIIY